MKTWFPIQVMSIRNIKLFVLGKKAYVPSESLGNFFAESAAICLDQFHEGNKVTIEIQGEYKQNIELEWESINQQIKDNWGNIEEASEYGATGIALLLVEHLTDYQEIQRSPKQTGFDYWFGKNKNNYLQVLKKRLLTLSNFLQPNTTNNKIEDEQDKPYMIFRIWLIHTFNLQGEPKSSLPLSEWPPHIYQ